MKHRNRIVLDVGITVRVYQDSIRIVPSRIDPRYRGIIATTTEGDTVCLRGSVNPAHIDPFYLIKTRAVQGDSHE